MFTRTLVHLYYILYGRRIRPRSQPHKPHNHISEQHLSALKDQQANINDLFNVFQT